MNKSMHNSEETQTCSIDARDLEVVEELHSLVSVRVSCVAVTYLVLVVCVCVCVCLCVCLCCVCVCVCVRVCVRARSHW